MFCNIFHVCYILQHKYNLDGLKYIFLFPDLVTYETIIEMKLKLII